MRGFRVLNRLTVVVLALILAGGVAPVLAQSPDDWQLLNRIFETANSINEDTARGAYDQCIDLGKEVAARELPPEQKLYFEAEIESCIAYAMNNGQFDDAAGDHCAHHFRFASLLAESIAAAQGPGRVAPEQMAAMTDRLQRATELGPQLGCTGDYTALLTSAAPSADAIAANEPGLPDRDLMNAIFNTTRAAKADQPVESIRACREHEATVAKSTALGDVERSYLEAIVENCVATAMARAEVADDTGDACVHHFAYAEKLAMALLFDMELKFFAADYREVAKEELAVAMRQGPEMGCPQDYAALAIE